MGPTRSNTGNHIKFEIWSCRHFNFEYVYISTYRPGTIRLQLEGNRLYNIESFVRSVVRKCLPMLEDFGT